MGEFPAIAPGRRFSVPARVHFIRAPQWCGSLSCFPLSFPPEGFEFGCGDGFSCDAAWGAGPAPCGGAPPWVDAVPGDGPLRGLGADPCEGSLRGPSAVPGEGWLRVGAGE